MSEEITDREFHDPDYIEAVPVSTKYSKISDEEKAEKIRQIVRREFDAEIARQENDLDILDDRLIEAKTTLSRLRYVVVKHHYSNEKLFPTDDEVQAEVISQSDPVSRLKIQSMLKNKQKQIHPAIKKIIGSGSKIDYDEILKVRAPRKRGKQEPALPQNLTIPVDPNIDSLRPEVKEEPIAGPSHSISLSKNLSASSCSAIDGDLEEAGDDKTLKVPRYIEPKGMNARVLEINPNIRNKQKTKFRIIIGNTSKYTAPQSKADRSTHKWLLYIRGPRDSPDISHFVSSVSVQLHDSYAPHNIFHLRSPPYHISRRGWGEFPVKLRIHFRNEKLNKSVNLEHLLKLDRNYSGLQELGGETVVDVWLYADDSMIENKTTDAEAKKVVTVPKQSLNRDRHNFLNSAFFPLNNLCNPNETINHDKCDDNIQNDTKDDQDSLLSNVVIKKEETPDDVLEINETRMECDIDYRVTLSNIKKEKNDGPNCLSDFNGCSIKIKDEPMDESMDSLYYNDNSDTNMRPHNNSFNDIGDLFEVSNTEVLPARSNYITSKISMSYISNTDKSVKKVIKKQVSLLKSNNSKSLLNPVLFYEPSPKTRQISAPKSVLNCNINLNKEKLYNNLSSLNSMLNDHCYVNEKYLIHNISEIKDNDEQKNPIKNVSVKNENFIHGTFDPSKNFNVLYTNNRILLDVDGATLMNNFPKVSHKIVLGRNNDSGFRIGLSKDDCLMRQKVIELVSFFRENLLRCADTRSAVSLMLKKMPMIDDLARSGEYLKAFPYAVQSADIYFSLSIPKRRNLEWTRAKILQNYLKIFFLKTKAKAETEIWTTKQIILFSHCYGYFPIKNTSTDTENAQFDDSNNFYVYGYNGEKTFQEKIDSKEQFASASHINTKTKIDVFTAREKKLEKFPVVTIKKEFPDTVDNLERNTDSKVSFNVSEIKIEPSYEVNFRDKNIVYELDDSSDEEIEICDLADIKSEPLHGDHLTTHEFSSKLANYELLPFESEDEKLRSFYIERKCAELGIELRNEHVGNGFSHSLVHKTILAALKCLVEDIVRRSLAVKMAALNSKTDVTIANIGQTVKSSPKLWDMTETGSVHTVSLRHVYEGILGRKEFDLLTNTGLGSDVVEYHGTF